MLRKGMILALIGGLGAFGLMACGDDSTPSGNCGDGIVNGDEQCDLTDLNSMTCADVVAGSTGILGCGADCTFDTTRCALCGDGAKTTGEQCDCGSDPNNLPDGCIGVNGDDPTTANCDTTCHKVAFCGDAQPDTGEECDCGTDPNNLPIGCDDVNGGANANCDDTCHNFSQCSVDAVWGECDPMAVNDCCADDWDVQMECTSLQGGSSYCLRPCSTDDECFWSNSCASQQGVCWPEICGSTNNLPNDNVGPMGQCQITGGGAGVCITFESWRTDTNQDPDPNARPAGVCVGEADPTTGKHQGETCTVWTDSLSVDRSETDMCLLGDCLPANQGDTTGTCVQFCSWEAAYDEAFNNGPAPTFLACPSGTTCLGIQTINPDTGLTGGDFGRCFQPESADPNGATPCDLVTGKLVSDPSQTCATDQDFTNGVCALLLVDSQTQEVTNGSLIGACMDGPTSGNVLNVWQDCDPNSTTDICPPQTNCMKADAFASTPALHEKCVPYCDVENTDCVAHIAANGGPSTFSATPVCTSESNAYPPNGPLDAYPSRVGLCVVPD